MIGLRGPVDVVLRDLCSSYANRTRDAFIVVAEVWDVMVNHEVGIVCRRVKPRDERGGSDRG